MKIALIFEKNAVQHKAYFISEFANVLIKNRGFDFALYDYLAPINNMLSSLMFINYSSISKDNNPKEDEKIDKAIRIKQDLSLFFEQFYSNLLKDRIRSNISEKMLIYNVSNINVSSLLKNVDGIDYDVKSIYIGYNDNDSYDYKLLLQEFKEEKLISEFINKNFKV